MRVNKLEYNKNPFIGLYATSGNKYTIVGSRARKMDSIISETLSTTIIHAQIEGSDLVGLFCAMDDNNVFVPWFMSQEEIAKLEEFLTVHVLENPHTAIGNNVVLHRDLALISENYNEKAFKEAGYETVKLKLDPFVTIGSVLAINKNGALAHPDIDEKKLDMLEEIIDKEVYIGTVNMGSGFVGNSMIWNDNGIIVGDKTSGFELARIDEALGD